MIRATAFILLFVGVLTAAAYNANAQGMEELSDIESAKARLEKYLEIAQRQSDARSVFFRVVETSHFQHNDHLQLLDTTGVVVADFDSKIQYSSNQVSSDKNDFPTRSELFRLKGKEKGKAYAAKTDTANSMAIEIKADENGQRSSWDKVGHFGAFHTEIDPLGLPIMLPVCAKSRFSSIENALVSWTTNWKFESQTSENGQLVSLWIDKNRSNRAKLLFDNRLGGMPVQLVVFTIDRNGNRTAESVSETKTAWKNSGGKWFPFQVESKTDGGGIDREFKVTIEILDAKQHDALIQRVAWAELWQTERSDWFGAIAKQVVELCQKQDKKN